MSLKILHLEDNAADAELIKRLLMRAQADCEVKVVDSGDAYERELSAQDYDVILSDSGIPGYDGRAALKLAQERRPGTPFIVVSGYVDQSPAALPHESQPTARVSKARLDTLPTVIHASLQSERARTSMSIQSVALIADLESRVALRTEEVRQGQNQIDVLNQELEAFSHSVAHDLRSPLLSIEGFAELLVESCDTAGSEDARECVAQITTAAARMRRRIDDLLTLSHVVLAPMNEAEVDLAQIAGSIAAHLQSLSPQRSVKFSACAARARGDAGMVRTVLENLLSNAWKFTRQNPNAEVELGVSGYYAGLTTFFLRDNGAGFDPRYSSHLFSPFHRLHSQEQFPGTGIGLAAVRRIVNRHGGKLSAEGCVGRGATFFFSLPSGGGAAPALSDKLPE